MKHWKLELETKLRLDLCLKSYGRRDCLLCKYLFLQNSYVSCTVSKFSIESLRVWKCSLVERCIRKYIHSYINSRLFISCYLRLREGVVIKKMSSNIPFTIRLWRFPFSYCSLNFPNIFFLTNLT